MKKPKWLIGVLLAFTIPLVSGCWDRLEIEDRGTILGLAIDPLGDADLSGGLTGPYAKSDVPGYKVTAQVAIPGRIPLGPGGGTSPGATEKPVWVVSATGRTFDGAMNKLQQELADRIFLGHLRVIIINRKIAQSSGISDIQDLLRRNPEVRRLAWLIISNDTALESMNAAPKLERVPTLYLVGTMDHSVDLGKLPNVFLGVYWSILSAKGQEPVLPLISVRGHDRIVVEGLAVFKGDKMVSSLDPLETAAYMELTNQHKAGYAVALPKPNEAHRSVMGKGYYRKEKIKMRKTDNSISFDAYSRIESNIEEKTGTKPINLNVPELEKEFSQQMKEGQEKLIRKTQALGVDIFGFGEYVRGGDPWLWVNDIKTRDKWDEMYRHIPIHCHVKIYIRRFGMAAH